VRTLKIMAIQIVAVVLSVIGGARAQQTLPKALDTPLPQQTLDLLANEVSGQMAYNNLVKLAGAPWLRGTEEFTGTLYEAELIHSMARKYGIETTRLERYPSTGTFDYPLEGELWITEPQRRLIARLGADAALIARGTRTADVSGELIYIPPLNQEAMKKMMESGAPSPFKGKLALMWSHTGGDLAKALDAAGVRGIISFSSRERYFDPNQVVYSGGSYGTFQNLKIGMTISWRQWSELLEDLQAGQKIVVRARTRVEQYADKFETVYSWIPGTEPDKKGVVFTAHLFEGYTKRGANDNMSGCVVQLEILRTLAKLIAAGDLPRPLRTIHFVWPNEISGTYEFIKQHAGFADTVSISINMDMVGEWLRKNNSLFTMSETPGHLPSFIDGLARSVMNYVWRTNDIVYLPDAARGRAGGQYFPIPLWEKNGSLDAFRFFTHRATGGSDHICFNNPSVAVPAIEFFTWPDQWYHADTDTADKADPTQLKRVAFIGAACAWAAANCADEIVGKLAEVTSDYGYARIAGRELPRSMARLEQADARTLAAEAVHATNLADYGARREMLALQSIREVYSASPQAQKAVDNRIRQWELYKTGLRSQVMAYAAFRAVQLSVQLPKEMEPTAALKKYLGVIPAIAPAVKGREFSLGRNEQYSAYMKENPEALKKLGLTAQQAAAVMNFVNGKRSIAEIGNDAAGELDEDVLIEGVAGYLELLKSFGWIVF